MILKTFTTDRGVAGCWTWYDNVESAKSYLSKELGCLCVSIKVKGSDEEIEVPITNPAYLCSDSGKTIERLHSTPWKIPDGQHNFIDDDGGN